MFGLHDETLKRPSALMSAITSIFARSKCQCRWMLSTQGICRVLAFIGHICAFAASSQLEHEQKTHIDKAFSSWMKCAFSALEVGDILLRSSFDNTTSAAVGVATLLSQQSNGKLFDVHVHGVAS